MLILLFLSLWGATPMSVHAATIYRHSLVVRFDPPTWPEVPRGSRKSEYNCTLAVETAPRRIYKDSHLNVRKEPEPTMSENFAGDLEQPQLFIGEHRDSLPGSTIVVERSCGTKYSHVNMKWLCRLSEGSTKLCTMFEFSNEHDDDEGDAALAYMKAGTTRLTSAELARKQEYLASNCVEKGDDTSAVFRVMGGLDGHYGEDDFGIEVRIGMAKYTLYSSDGIFFGDLEYCPRHGETNFPVSVKGWESDLLFDDKYITTSPTSYSVRGETSVFNLYRSGWGRYHGSYIEIMQVR